MSTARTLDRVFRIGATTLPIANGLTIEQALQMYQGTYPHLAHCTVDEPVVEGGQLVYQVVRPPAQTKGARVASQRQQKADEATDKAMTSLNAWADADTTADFDANLHGAVGSYLLALQKKAASPLDPFDVCLA